MEPGGIFSEIYGPCPVAKLMKYDGINGGRGAGRICWSILNSSPRDSQPVCRNTRQSCFDCEFYRRVQNEEESTVAAELAEDNRTTFKFLLS